jgi:hypothetical protein
MTWFELIRARRAEFEVAEQPPAAHANARTWTRDGEIPAAHKCTACNARPLTGEKRPSICATKTIRRYAVE